MEEMNYNPGSTLRTSSGRKTGLVGVIVPSLEHPFFARMMRCIEFELSRHDYKCIACNTIDLSLIHIFTISQSRMVAHEKFSPTKGVQRPAAMDFIVMTGFFAS